MLGCARGRQIGAGAAAWALGLALWAMGCSTGGLTLPPPLFPRTPLQTTWPDVGALVLEDVAKLSYRLDAGGERVVAVLDHRRRIQVLTEAGLGAANVVLPIDAYSTISRVVGRSVSPEMQQVQVGNAAVDLRPTAPATPGAVTAPELRDLHLHIPGASVGGLVEYRYERVYQDASLVPPWIFGGLMPVLHAEMALQQVPAIKLDYRFGIGKRLEEKAPLHRQDNAGHEVLVFIEKDLPAFYPAPLMPHPSRQAPWLTVALRAVRGAKGQQRFDAWETAAAPQLQRMRQVGGAAVTGDLMQRYHRVRLALKPLGQLGLGLRSPVAAKALWHGAPACSRDAAALLLAGAFADRARSRPTPALVHGATQTAPHVQWATFLPCTPLPGRWWGWTPHRGDAQLAEQLRYRRPARSRVVAVRLPAAGATCCWLDPSCKTCAYGVIPASSMRQRPGAAGGGKGRQPVGGHAARTRPQRHRAAHPGPVGHGRDGAHAGHVDGVATTAPWRSGRACRLAGGARPDGGRCAPTSPRLPGPAAKRRAGAGARPRRRLGVRPPPKHLAQPAPLERARAAMADLGAPTILGGMRAKPLEDAARRLRVHGHAGGARPTRQDFENYPPGRRADLAGHQHARPPGRTTRRTTGPARRPTLAGDATPRCSLPIGYRC